MTTDLPDPVADPPAADAEWKSSFATDRIVWVDPADLLAHPMNPRRHPAGQRDALRESLRRVGWMDVVKVNVATGHVVDGHARIEEAISAGAPVPVVYVDLPPEDEAFALATLDPISAMAVYDAEVMADLLAGVDVESRELASLLKVHAHDFPEPGAGGPGPDDGGAEPDPADYWPLIEVRVPPVVMTAWAEALAGHDGDAVALLADVLGVAGA